MWAIWTISELVALAMLGTYLFAKHRQRVRRLASAEPETGSWTGTGLDTSQIAPRVAQLRRSHSAALHPGTGAASYHAGLLALARNMVRDFAYFRARAPISSEVARTEIISD